MFIVYLSFWITKTLIFPILIFTDLSHNRITKITINAFGHLSNLTALDLSYNQLVKLQPDTVRPLRHLKTLNISGNSQIDMYDIRRTFNVSFVVIYYYYYYYYATPNANT